MKYLVMDYGEDMLREILMEELDALGEGGWELVAVHERRNLKFSCATYRYIFKHE